MLIDFQLEYTRMNILFQSSKEDMILFNELFQSGNDQIKQMNRIVSDDSVSNSTMAAMGNVIVSLKSSIERYKKYSTIGPIKKMFTSDIEINARIIIAQYEFEKYLTQGATISQTLQNQVEQCDTMYRDLEGIQRSFSIAIQQIDDNISKFNSRHEYDRLLRKRDDILSAQIMCQNTAVQCKLLQNNINILIDRFHSIEMILKPAIEMNMKLSSNILKSLKHL